MADIKIAIKPPEVVCQTLMTGINTAYSLHETIEKLRITMRKIVKTLLAAKFGFSHDIDSILGALSMAVSTIAAQVADAVIGAGSMALKQIMSRVMSLLMEICMAGPRALLSLVAFPMEQALHYSADEYKHLKIALEEFRKVEYLIALLGDDDMLDQIHNQMREAMRYLDKAIPDFQAVIDSTRGTAPDFDTNNYRSAMANMRNAAKVSAPSSALIAASDFQNKVDARAAVLEEKRRQDVLVQFNINKAKAMQLRNDDVAGIKEVGSLAGTLSVEGYNRTYLATVKGLETHRDADLAGNKIACRTQAMADVIADMARAAGYRDPNGKNKIRNLDQNSTAMLKSLGALNKYVVIAEAQTEILSAYESIASHLGLAYPSYKIAHSFVAMTYNIYDVIKTTYADLSELIGKVSEGVTVTSRPAVMLAKSTCQAVRKIYSEEITKKSNIIATSRASVKLGAGHIMLESVNSTTDALINDAMIAAMHMDDQADAEMSVYEGFRDRLRSIPDWDGQKNVWAITVIGSQMAPYADIAIAQLGIGTLRPEALRDGLIAIGTGIRELMKHNRVVDSTLNSYTPPYNNASVKLRATLAAVGLLYEFAKNMSVKSFGASMQSMIGVDGVKASVAGCAESYPEMFNNKAWQYFTGKSGQGRHSRESGILADAKPGAQTKYQSLKSELRAGDFDKTFWNLGPDDTNSPGGESRPEA